MSEEGLCPDERIRQRARGRGGEAQAAKRAEPSAKSKK